MSIFILLLISAFGFAGCGDDGSPGGNNTPVNPEPEPEPEPDPECMDEDRRCVNDDVEVCVGGQFTTLGPCPSGTECEFGDCVAQCQTQCSDRACGFDGCDGVCGECDEGQACNSDGECVEPSAECGDDVCEDSEDCALCPADCGQCCGDGTCNDGQGENCSTCLADCGCEDGQDCDPERRNCVDQCVPQCDGRQCGPDGCNGECAQCDNGDVCNGDGQCVEPPAECGDDVCGDDEDCATCPSDCGQCCGDGACNDT